tara:strand:- start:13886 stop:14596 length:711 start_codon:yes stop_codon:yes gene_type:complete
VISFFIPIRKGSKRVKDKNIKPLPGYRYGVTELKIKQLLRLKKLLKKQKKNDLSKFEFIVSTDCAKTKKYLQKFKWLKIHNRPKELATDDSLDLLIKEVSNICSGKYILWTHVTSPFFNERDYLDFLVQFFKNKNKKSKSAFSADIINKFIFSKKKGGWVSHDANKKKWPRTQDLNNLFVANSAAFIAEREVYKKNKDRLCKYTFPILTRDLSGFDLDNKKDFQHLKKLINPRSKV